MPMTAESYSAVIAGRIESERVNLSTRWLAQLRALLPVPAIEVFPSEALLDHIPSLLAEIARYLRAPQTEEISANAGVIEKARELGMLRHRQQASVHQLLREYEMLADILEDFVALETERLAVEPLSAECLAVMRRLTKAVRALMRTTVDTFISEYTHTIEAQTEQLRSFSRIASHELRSPVSTILFGASLIALDDIRRDPVRFTKVAHTIRSNAERLGQLLDTLRRVARLDDPSDSPSEQRIEVGAVANEVARQLEEMATARGVTIDVDPALPILFVDPARLELVLLNLVSNGIKYSDPAKFDRRVRIALRHQSSDTCTVCVEDNGLGIPAEAREDIFRRFFRAHAELDDELGIQGSGLGLAIVADCVEALRGAITCESRVGEGTCFSLDLPCRAP
jgi:signal transduction histidine kinase